MSTQYGTVDRVTTWLVDKLLIGPLFWLDRAIDNAFADFGTVD